MAGPFILGRKFRRLFFLVLIVGLVMFLFHRTTIIPNEFSLSDIKVLRKTGNEVADIDETPFILPDGTLSSHAVDYIKPYFGKKGKRPKACIYALSRNSERDKLMLTIRQVQRRFNDKYKYDWVLLNDEEFTEEFKREIQDTAPGVTFKFGLIPKEEWSFPDFIDPAEAERTRERMKDIIYGKSKPYRFMCRYQSGFFWRHPLLMEYDWYWKVEPNVRFLCDVKYDVFQWMQDNEIAYGFGIAMREYRETIPTLWDTVKGFMKENPDYIADDNFIDFISDDGGKTYNMCHFWGNFEIGSFHLWRSPPYRAFFDYLDHAKGFFYERWGDAPVRSIAASLLLPKDKIHFFSDIGYRHAPYDHCPVDYDIWKELNCECLRNEDFMQKDSSCGKRYREVRGEDKPADWRKMASSFN